MKTSSSFSIRAVTVLLVLAGCGGDREGSEAGPAQEPFIDPAEMQEAEEMIENELARVAREEAARFPCSAFSQAEIQTIAGDSLERPSYAFLNKTEDVNQWQAESCDWLGTGEDAVQVTLWVSRAEHFPSGRVECYFLGGSPRTEGLEVLPGLREARWDFPGFGRGTLRACTDRALVEVLVDRPDENEAAAFETARKVIEKTLASQPASGVGSSP